MSDDQIIGGLVNRLRGLACPAGEPWTGTTPESDHGHTDCFIIHRAADALEAAEADLARLEHQIHQAEEATTAAYKDAETAEAKLAAIDALHWRTTEYPEMGNFAWCYGCSHEWPCPTHRILHPEEER